MLIGNWHKSWNRELEAELLRKAKQKISGLAWAEQPQTINEVGSMFTIQGFDLNYAGVILGPYRYNEIYKVQMPNITPHVCRHTFCSNMAKSGMNPKTLQYIMDHSDISVTLNTYTHLNYDDAEEEMQKVVEASSKKSTTHRKRCVS